MKNLIINQVNKLTLTKGAYKLLNSFKKSNLSAHKITKNDYRLSNLTGNMEELIEEFEYKKKLTIICEGELQQLDITIPNVTMFNIADEIINTKLKENNEINLNKLSMIDVKEEVLEIFRNDKDNFCYHRFKPLYIKYENFIYLKISTIILAKLKYIK